MKKLSILLSLVFGLFIVSTANAQTPITYKIGTEKVLTITVPAGKEKLYSMTVKKGQVINLGISGDIGVSKTNDFPVISLNLNNGVEDVDRSQDGEGYLSILAGRNGKYIVNVANSDKKRARTFKLKVTVSNNKEDFLGGEEVDQ
jgi:hypothetical protein